LLVALRQRCDLMLHSPHELCPIIKHTTTRIVSAWIAILALLLSAAITSSA